MAIVVPVMPLSPSDPLRLPEPSAPLITLVGWPGAGKTTVAEILSRYLEVPVFHLDSVLRERDKRPSTDFLDKFGFNEADSYIRTLMEGRSVTYMGYSQDTKKRDTQITINPGPRLKAIIEGVLPFHIPVVASSPHLAMWISTPLLEAERRQYVRGRRDGWYPGLTEQEILATIWEKRFSEIPEITQQRSRCQLMLDNSGQHIEGLRHEAPNGQNESRLLVIANDRLKPALARVLAQNIEILETRYHVIAGTSSSLALAQDLLSRTSRVYVDFGPGPDEGDSHAMSYMEAESAAGHHVEAIVFIDPYVEKHEHWKNALLRTPLRTNVIWLGNEATAMAFYQGLKKGVETAA